MATWTHRELKYMNMQNLHKGGLVDWLCTYEHIYIYIFIVIIYSIS